MAQLSIPQMIMAAKNRISTFPENGMARRMAVKLTNDTIMVFLVPYRSAKVPPIPPPLTAAAPNKKYIKLIQVPSSPVASWMNGFK